jgi:hypothetical protein
MKYLFKRSAILVFIIILIVSIIQPSVYANTNISNKLFIDIASHWAENEILELAQKGIINGMGNHKYEPELNVTREQFIKLLVLTNGDIKNVENQFLFSDLKETSWSYPYILTAVHSGIIYTTDYKNNIIEPKKNINREEASLMISRMLGLYNKSDTELTDIKNLRCQDAANSVVNAKIILGFPDKTFRGNNLMTRAQSAMLIKRILDYIKKDSIQRDSSNTVSLKDEIIPLDNTTYKDIESINFTKNKMVLNNSEDFTDMKEGDIFQLPPNNEYIGGVIREITSINGNIITFKEPELNTVINDFDICKSTDVPFENFEINKELLNSEQQENLNVNSTKTENIKIHKATYYKSKASDKNGAGITVIISKNKLELELKDLKIGSFMRVSGEMNLNDAKLETDSEFNLSGEKKLTAIFKCKNSTDLTVNIGPEVDNEENKEKDTKVSLGKLPIPVCGPVYAEADIQLIISAEGSVEVKISLLNDIEAGFTYSNDNNMGFVPINKSKSDAKIYPTKLKAGVELIISPVVSLKFAGMDFVNIKLKPGVALKVEFDPFLTSNYLHGNLYVEFSIEVEGFKFLTEVLKIDELSFEWEMWNENNTPWQRLFCLNLKDFKIKFVNNFSECSHYNSSADDENYEEVSDSSTQFVQDFAGLPPFSEISSIDKVWIVNKYYLSAKRFFDNGLYDKYNLDSFIKLNDIEKIAQKNINPNITMNNLDDFSSLDTATACSPKWIKEKSIFGFFGSGGYHNMEKLYALESFENHGKYFVRGFDFCLSFENEYFPDSNPRGKVYAMEFDSSNKSHYIKVGTFILNETTGKINYKFTKNLDGFMQYCYVLEKNNIQNLTLISKYIINQETNKTNKEMLPIVNTLKENPTPLDIEKEYLYDLNGDGINETIKYTEKGESFNDHYKIFVLTINGKEVSWMEGLYTTVAIMDLDKNDSFIELQIQCSSESACLNDYQIAQYNKKYNILLNYNNIKFLDNNIKFVRGGNVSNLKGNGNFTITIDTPIYNNNLGCYYCKVPFLLSNGSIKNTLTKEYELEKLSSFTYTLAKNVMLYKKPNTTEKLTQLSKGTTLTPIALVFYGKNTTNYFKVKVSDGTIGYLPLSLNDIFEELPAWG